MRMEGGPSPPTLIASKGSPLRSLDRHTSLSLVFGQVFTDSTLESWSLGGISDDFQNEHTQSFPTLVLAFAVPRTFDWWSPTWVPRTLVSSVWLGAKLANMCAARGEDSGTSTRCPVERGTHSFGRDPAQGGLHFHVLAPSSFLDVCVTVTCRGWLW